MTVFVSCSYLIDPSLSVGTLLDCYDELGNRYQLPIYCISAPVNLIEGSDCDSPSPESEPYNGTPVTDLRGEELIVKFRISSLQNDVKMGVFTKESILSGKKRLGISQGFEPRDQRWYFGGRLLQDKCKIEEVKLQSGFVVQVVVNNSYT